MRSISSKMNKTKKQTSEEDVSQKDLSVALLIEDVEVARDLSRIFRKIGVMPFIYQQLDEFWDDIYGQRPSLSVVDVSLMSEGTRLLKEHPLVKSNQIDLCFFYTQENYPLLHSTYDLNHLGLISREISLKGQVKSILRRFNEKVELKNGLNHFKMQEKKLEGHINGLLRQLEYLKEKEFYSDLSDNIIDRFDNLKSVHSFEEAVDRVFGQLKEIRSFSIYELAKNGQKLLSPYLSSSKYVSLPPVWLGASNDQGIQSISQGMAQQVGAEVLGGELMALSIFGEQENPEKLILVKLADSDSLNHLNWDRVERFLSGLYARYELINQEIEQDSGFEISPWKLMTLLDRSYLDGKTLVLNPKLEENVSTEHDRLKDVKKVGRQYSLVEINFEKLLNFLRERSGKSRFYWNDFHREFFKRFETQCKGHFRLASFGVHKSLLLIDGSDASRMFSQMRAYVKRYPFWKYFEDVDIVLARDLRPEIRMLPVSSIAVLNSLENGLGNLESRASQHAAVVEIKDRDQEVSEQEHEEIVFQMHEAQSSQLNKAFSTFRKLLNQRFQDDQKISSNEEDIISSIEFVTDYSQYQNLEEERSSHRKNFGEKSLEI